MAEEIIATLRKVIAERDAEISRLKKENQELAQNISCVKDELRSMLLGKETHGNS